MLWIAFVRKFITNGFIKFYLQDQYYLNSQELIQWSTVLIFSENNEFNVLGIC